MRVQVENHEYELNWKYRFRLTKGGQRRKNRPPHSTVCYLKSGQEVIGEAQIRLLSGDVPCYEKARKISLKKLLETITPGARYREFRGTVWKAYFNRKNTGKNEKTLQEHEPSVSQEKPSNGLPDEKFAESIGHHISGV